MQGGLSRTASLQAQIELSGQQREPGSSNAWVDTGTRSLRLKNAPGFPTISSTSFGGTVGLDSRTPGGVLLGAALTIGGQAQRFSTGGHCDQADEALSLYATGHTGRIWGNAVATFGLLQDRIARPVTLGLFTDPNRADTDGHSLALALRGGCDFHLGPVATGPVVGAVLQQVHLAGFTEAGASAVTSLAIGGQTRNTGVSQLGWHAAIDLGPWQVFADAEWNHDWAGRNREMTAALTSIATTPYTTSAAPVAADWATATLGISCKLNSRLMLRVATTVVLGNPQVTSYGGELALSAGF